MTEPRLTDGVIVLDRHTLADAEDHLGGEDEEQARRFGWHPARSTPETVRHAIEKWQAEWLFSGPKRAFAMREAKTGSLIGGCELSLLDDGRAEMSYWVFPPFRRRGFAARAISLASEWAFDELAVERIDLYIEPDNAASRAAAERAGFTEERLLPGHRQFGPDDRRDMVLYTRLRAATY